MPPLRHFIFDWSGTLVDDLPPVIHATNAVMRHHGVPELTREQFLHEFELPFARFYARKLPGADLATLEPIFHEAFVQSTEKASPLPHAEAFLRFCQSTGRRCYVLSAAHPDHLQKQAADFSFLPFFDEVHAGIRDKTAEIHAILARHRLDPTETVFIGDMTHDVETAHHGGVRSIAVLTGYQDAARLASARPDVIIRDLSHLQQLLSPL